MTTVERNQGGIKTSNNYVPQIDPVKSAETFRELASRGLATPGYSKIGHNVPIGQILRTPPDTTQIQHSPKSSVGSFGVPEVVNAPIPSRQAPRIASPIDLLGSYSTTTPIYPGIAGYMSPDGNVYHAPDGRVYQITSSPKQSPQQKSTPGKKYSPAKEDTRYQYQQSMPRPINEEKRYQYQQSVPRPINEEATDPLQDARIRADYRVKFSILRDAYPTMNIPDPEDDQPIPHVVEMYKEYVKRIHIDSSVEQNNTYLVIMWLLIELVGCRFFKLPMAGYFQNQFKYMNKYQMLLIELGERSYTTGGGVMDGWPVEARLLLMAVFNGVIFVIVKLLANKMGIDPSKADEFTEMIDNFLTKGGKGKKEVLRMADEATVDNIPVAQPEPEDPLAALGPLGGLLGPVLGMFNGGGGNNATKTTPVAEPQKKKPTTFGSRSRKAAADATITEDT